MAEPITLLTVAKFPFALIWRGLKYVAALFTAPGRIAKLERQAADAQDPRPICTTCGKGRVSVFHHDEGGIDAVPRTYGVCGNQACNADWLMSANGAKLYRRQ